MMRAAQLRRVFGLTLIALLSGLVSCKSPAAASETPMPSETTNAAQQRVVGTLTRKGAEFNAWWALSDAQGKVWRLQTSSAEQAKQFEAWQNKRVEISGVKIENYLATEQLRVNSVQLLP
jgi:hypothetical protein